jgi:hypothetical protein
VLQKASGREARLSDLLALHARQAPSFGSTQHNQGMCNACSFHFLRRRGRPREPCRNGYMCTYCHHPDHAKPAANRLSTRKNRPKNTTFRQQVLV